ncbi:hypothetical protein E3N88_07354 [Mikania micrantha]|uniref:Uncharacterized protein n=1 Tax=Mikania micrantha TaxID=192012 RepID=A0A5N6PRD8_9ASTR|nr:hypothetical protein E3N88_07354 [Mikania micrantha]
MLDQLLLLLDLPFSQVDGVGGLLFASFKLQALDSSNLSSPRCFNGFQELQWRFSRRRDEEMQEHRPTRSTEARRTARVQRLGGFSSSSARIARSEAPGQAYRLDPRSGPIWPIFILWPILRVFLDYDRRFETYEHHFIYFRFPRT